VIERPTRNGSEYVKSLFVVPAKAGIQGCKTVAVALDPRFRGGDVLDPFCGCGSTIEAAQKLERRWIGIGVAHDAIDIAEDRLRTAFGKQSPSRFSFYCGTHIKMG
jgi:hypothetical protein